MAGGPEDDITALARSSWRRVLSAARGMEVFVDRPCMESLHWTLGDAAAFQSGVMNVRPFPCPPSTLRVVTEAMFVLGSPLSTSGALRETLSSSGLHRCVIATAVSHGAHVEILGATAGPEAETNPHFVFKHLEEKIRGWLGFKDARVQVLHFPGLSFAPVIRGFLFTPAFSSMSPLLPSDLGPMNRSRPAKKRFRSLAELDVHALPSGFHKALCLLASTVEDVLGALAVREECFFVGPTARLAALKLANSARSRIRRKNALGRASVVFLDRSLDLAGAVAHHGDTLADRILDLLPRLPGGHTADVAVNIVALTSVVPGDWGPEVVVPGCVAQSQPAGRLALWESMMLSKQKEALMEVRRQLVEGAGKAGLPIRTSIGKVTADQLESYVRAFRSDWDLCVSHAGLLQLGLATVQALRCPLASHRDTLLGAEKLLLQSLRNGDIPKVLLQLCSRLQHSGGHDDFSPLDIILLLTYVYSLSGAEALNGGEEQELAEAELCKALFHALGDSCHLWGSLEDGTGGMPAAEEKDTWLRGLFVKLRGVAQAPSSLHHFRIYEQGDSTHQALYHPLIKQVLDEALSTEQAESSDLEHMTSGLTDLLKTGFGMFMKVTRPKPSDHPLIIIFVLGGVTPGEVKLVRDTLMTRKPSHQVILLSTRLLRPSDVPPLIFSDDRLDPIFDF